MIGYDPPAGSTPNPNDPQDGNATVDAGIPGSSAAVVKALLFFFFAHSPFHPCLSFDDEVEVEWVMNLHQMGDRAGLRATPRPRPGPLRSASGWPGRRIPTD